MITIEKKDLIVAYIVSKNKALLNIEACDFSDNEINYDELIMILKQLETLDFIKITHQYSNPRGVCISVNASLSDFSSRGAFRSQELILAANLEKLDTELKLIRMQLEPKNIDQLNKVVTLFSSVCGLIPYVQTALTSSK